jgi:hypothetical protein
MTEKNLPDTVNQAYRAAFGRSPTAEESAAGVEYLTTRGADDKQDRALQDYALKLFSLNEFIYVE